MNQREQDQLRTFFDARARMQMPKQHIPRANLGPKMPFGIGGGIMQPPDLSAYEDAQPAGTPVPEYLTPAAEVLSRLAALVDRSGRLHAVSGGLERMLFGTQHGGETMLEATQPQIPPALMPSFFPLVFDALLVIDRDLLATLDTLDDVIRRVEINP